MNKCIICNQEIKTDSQFINGNWYHNNCIELMTKKLEAYENMRKEAIEELKNWEKLDLDNLLVVIKKVENILNKVGDSDE